MSPPPTNRSPRQQNAVVSSILRFGVTSAWLFVLGVLQVVFVSLIHRFVSNPITQFIDLMFLANISLIIFDDRCAGYYIHGRNMAQHSDTELAVLNAELLKEEEGLVARRGFVPASRPQAAENQVFRCDHRSPCGTHQPTPLPTDQHPTYPTRPNVFTHSLFYSFIRSFTYSYIHSTMIHSIMIHSYIHSIMIIACSFRIFITDELRRKYENKLLSQVERAAADQKQRRGAVSTFLKGPLGRKDAAMHDAKVEVTRLFKQMIDDVQQQSATCVVDPTYWQMVHRLPPGGSEDTNVFVHDYQRTFTSVLFWGAEARLYAFEAFFLLVIDWKLQNIGTSAFITYVLSRALKWLRHQMGENNLAAKTMVDSKFLI